MWFRCKHIAMVSPVMAYLYLQALLLLELCSQVTSWNMHVQPNVRLQLQDVSDVKKFIINKDEESGVNYYKLLMTEGEQMLIGARNKILNISMVTLNETTIIRRLEWTPRSYDTAICEQKSQSKELCQNYIRVLGKDNDQKFFVCGTHAFAPKCRKYEYQVDKGEFKLEQEESGIGKCPFDPRHNSTAVYTDGKLYAGTVSDFQAMLSLIMEGTESPRRTVEHDSNLLNMPNFVSSFDIDDKIYFFFRELAVENINCGKTTFSRVARICKNDQGGNTAMKGSWTSFFKARLNCSIPGEFPFYFDELKATSEMSQGNYRSTSKSDDRARMFYGVFNTPDNSIRGSAICAYRYSDIVNVFSGKFKGQESAAHNWLSVPESKTPIPHPQTCVNNSQEIEVTTLTFIKSHPLMDAAVQPAGGGPVLIHTSFSARFSAITVDWQVIAADNRFYDIMYVGTDDGRVLKSINKGQGSEVESVVIEDIQVMAKNEPIISLKIYKGRIERLIVMSQENIVSIPLHRCSQQKTCSDCVKLQDPQCAWSDGKCMARPKGIHNILHGTPEVCPDAGKPEGTSKRTTTSTPVPPSASVPQTCTPCICPPKANLPETEDGQQNHVTRSSTTFSPASDSVIGINKKELLPCAPSVVEIRNDDQVYTASTLAIALVISVVVSMLVGLVIGYRISVCRHHTRNPEQMIAYEQNFGSLRKNPNRHSMDGSHNLMNHYTEPKKLNFVSNLPASKSPNLPNGTIESKIIPNNPNKTYI
ncbi:hypothetical protein ACJMK2_044393 [Sinanodonta woodiana]|uniref:Semaphorin-2A n=1 Tax=Sinanodonta woodiana TaxID=1069815 RepID=A0ABD3VZX7_SINWO